MMKSTGLFNRYARLHEKYFCTKTEEILGYKPYRGAAAETTFNLKRIDLTSAALLQLNMSLHDLVHYIGGPHKAAHRDVNRIRRCISHLPPTMVEAYMDRIIYGAPRVCDAYSSN